MWGTAVEFNQLKGLTLSAIRGMEKGSDEFEEIV